MSDNINSQKAIENRLRHLELELKALKNAGKKYTPSVFDNKLTRLENEVASLRKIVKITLGMWSDWTPTITYYYGTTDPTSTVINTARYSKIGRVVYFNVELDITRGSGDRQAMTISLPSSHEALYDTVMFAYVTIVASVVGIASVLSASNKIWVSFGTMISDGTVALSGFYLSLIHI